MTWRPSALLSKPFRCRSCTVLHTRASRSTPLHAHPTPLYRMTAMLSMKFALAAPGTAAAPQRQQRARHHTHKSHAVTAAAVPSAAGARDPAAAAAAAAPDAVSIGSSR